MPHPLPVRDSSGGFDRATVAEITPIGEDCHDHDPAFPRRLPPVTLGALMRLSLLLLLAAGCTVDNTLSGKNDGLDGFDSGDGFQTDTDTDQVDTQPTEEVCNGTDDDGDGEVDEGFPDADANGRADCLDTTCPALDLGSAGIVTVPEECTGTGTTSTAEVPDAWNVKIQWQVKSPSTDASATSSYAQAVIGNLNDDNGDGAIDEDDTPEVIVNMFGAQCHTVALNGADGTEEWVWDGCLMTAGVITADVDADGAPDVVTYNTSARPVALNGDGSLKWTATSSPSSTSYPLLTVADLDNDGQPEVIADDLVLDGATGSKLFSLNNSASNPYRIAAVADADGDGDQEIFLAGKAYDSDGTLLWDTKEVGTYGFWPVIVQADGDDEAEIGFVGQHWSLWDDDGTNIYTTTYNSQAQPGPPCAGDFDGDGEAEVAWPAFQNFVMYELDGTKVWSVPMDDTSGLAGCSGYDVNGDGALEILFADQSSFTIFDGATGAENYVNTNHRSGTVFEYPSVADIDHDGHAEIVFVSNYWSGAWGVVTALEHNGVGWPAAGSTWAIHDFAITNINPDGSVPEHPDPWWTKYNVYRSRVAADDPSTPDLAVAITDSCIADCQYGPVKVGVQVSNRGGADVSAGEVLHLYADDDTGRRLVATYTLPEIPAGTAMDGIEFTLTAADIGSFGWVAVVDEEELLNECDETNNTDFWSDAVCP